MITLEQIEAFCEGAALEMFEKQGEIKSHFIYMVEIDGKEGLIYSPYAGENQKEKEATKRSALSLLGMMKAAGVFRAVCLVGEAWVSHFPKDQAAIMDVMAPRHDPDRKECVFVSVFRDNEKSFKGWEIKRTEDGKAHLEVLEDWDRKTENNQSWLDVAMKPVDVSKEIQKIALQKLKEMLGKGEIIK